MPKPNKADRLAQLSQGSVAILAQVLGLQWFAGAALRCFLPCRAMSDWRDGWSEDARGHWTTRGWRQSTFNLWQPKFEGHGSDLVHKNIVVAVRKVQGSNLAGDDLWQSWVETFAGPSGLILDPARHSLEFLLAFLSHVESVELTLKSHQELAMQIGARSVKERRLQERLLPDELYDGLSRTLRGVPSSSDRRPLLAAETQTEAVTPPPVLAAETQTEEPPASPASPASWLAPPAETQTEEPRHTYRIPWQVEDFWSGIPKQIWVSGPNYDKLSPWYTDHLNDMLRRAPGWVVNFVDDRQMLERIAFDCTEREQQCFERINPKYGPARADFLRYVLMRTYGGLWLDLKSGFVGDLNKNLEKFFPLPPLVLGHWGWPNQHDVIPEDVHNFGEIEQWWLLSAPGHPVWNTVLDAVCTNIERYTPADGFGKQIVLCVTGPIAMSRAMYPKLITFPHLLLRDKEYKFEYDQLGHHAKKQDQMGAATPHYSKLKEPLITPYVRPSSRASAAPLDF